MTAVEWLFEQMLINNYISKQQLENAHWLIIESKEMEKQQIIDAYAQGRFDYEDYSKGIKQKVKQSKQYYNETYGSKGSDETNGNNVEEVPNVLDDAFNQELFNYFSQEFNINLLSTEMHDIIDIVKRHTSSQTEISDEKIIKQGFLHSFLNELPDENALSWIEGFKSCIKQLQISNNDIYKAGEEYFNEHVDDKGYDGFIEGAKWYREQLKKKQ